MDCYSINCDLEGLWFIGYVCFWVLRLCWWCSLLILSFDFCFVFFVGGGFGLICCMFCFAGLVWVCFVLFCFLFVLVVGVGVYDWVWVECGLFCWWLVVGGFWVDGLFVLFLVFCLCLFSWDLGFVLSLVVWLLVVCWLVVLFWGLVVVKWWCLLVFFVFDITRVVGLFVGGFVLGCCLVGVYLCWCVF